jgi:hypothetical protein
VDVDRQAWFIPTSKTGKSRHVPLSTAALAIVATLPRYSFSLLSGHAPVASCS